MLGTLGQSFKLRLPLYSSQNSTGSMIESGSNWFSDGTEDNNTGPRFVACRDKQTIARARMVAATGSGAASDGGNANSHSGRTQSFGRSFAWLSRTSTAPGKVGTGNLKASSSKMMTSRGLFAQSNSSTAVPPQPSATLKPGASQSWPVRSQEHLRDNQTTFGASIPSGFVDQRGQTGNGERFRLRLESRTRKQIHLP